MTTTPESFHFIEIRQRHNGIPQDMGGYTLAVVHTGDNLYRVSMSICPLTKPWSEKFGKNMAVKHMKAKQFQTVSYERLHEIAQAFQSKMNTGFITPAVDLSHIPQ